MACCAARAATRRSTATTAPPPVATSHLAAPAVVRWGRTGHRLIARVATARLSGEARRQVRDLLGRESLAAVSTWADSIRNDRPETSPWHYVNIPVIDSVYRPERYCPGGDCVVAALERQIGVLANRGASKAERAEALKWVVHLVEDIHMPLHAGDRGDRGGNDVQLTFLGRATKNCNEFLGSHNGVQSYLGFYDLRMQENSQPPR